MRVKYLVEPISWFLNQINSWEGADRWYWSHLMTTLNERFKVESGTNLMGDYMIPVNQEFILLGGRESIADDLIKFGPEKFIKTTCLQAFFAYFRSGNLLKPNYSLVVITAAGAFQPAWCRSIGTIDVIFGSDNVSPKGYCYNRKEFAEVIRRQKV